MKQTKKTLQFLKKQQRVLVIKRKSPFHKLIKESSYLVYCGQPNYPIKPKDMITGELGIYFGYRIIIHPTGGYC